MDKKYYMGFDIGGTHARCSLIETDGQDSYHILANQKRYIRNTQQPSELSAIIREATLSILQEQNIALARLQGIGIAIAGQIDTDEATILNAPNLGWRNVHFKNAILEAFPEIAATPPKIRIANDLNAIAWGEYQLGAAKNEENLLVVYVGTGIGAGLIINKNLYIGAGNVSGEIGHVKFPGGNPRKCGCGQLGCVEAFAGGKAIENRIIEDIEAGKITKAALKLAEGEHPTAKAIESAYKDGLPYATAFWDITATHIAHMLANALAILNPGGLLLGGGVLDNCPALKAAVLKKLPELCPATAYARLKCYEPVLGDDAGTLGAALLCKNEI